MNPRAPQRRTFLAGSAAATAAIWAAPAVTTLGRVAAATGSCGVPLLQLDWSGQRNNSRPDTIIAADGTRVTFTVLAPPSPSDRNFRVRHLAAGGTSDFLYLKSAKGGGGARDLVLQIDFDRPVQLCFTLLEVDAFPGEWEDTVAVVGSNSGTPVDLDATDMVLQGTAVSYLGPNTVRGLSPAGGTAVGNVEVSYSSPVDRVTITYSDDSGGGTSDFVGLHDLRWC